jgi:hypothetical protein
VRTGRGETALIARTVISVGSRVVGGLKVGSFALVLLLTIAIVATLWGAGLWRFGIDATSVVIKEFFQSVGFIITGVVGLFGLLYTARNARINQRNLQLNLENTQRTLELTEQSQITERFTRAIDQLGATDDKGNKKLEIRIGGIYALERIARDSPKRDCSTVMEVLAAYVRENAPWVPKRSSVPTMRQKEGGERGKVTRQDAPHSLQGPCADIRAIMDVLRRRDEYKSILLDLSKTHLRRADLQGADLEGANFQEAFLLAAKLQGANFRRADLRGADLRGADLQGAFLLEADLEGADLRGSDLRGTFLLTHEQLQAAIGDETTKLPKDLTKPGSWNSNNGVQVNGNEQAHHPVQSIPLRVFEKLSRQFDEQGYADSDI